jgi:hypothetical protein
MRVHMSAGALYLDTLSNRSLYPPRSGFGRSCSGPAPDRPCGGVAQLVRAAES